MLDGTYYVEIDSRGERKSGTVTLRTEGDKVSCSIDAPIIGKKEVMAQLVGNDAFTAQGSLKVMLVSTVNYSLQGELHGNDLHVSAETDKGNFEVIGVRL